MCFHYDERYSFNHECKKIFWFEIEDGNDQDLAVEVIEEEQVGDKPEILLNAMVGVSTPQTIRVTTII